MTTHGEARLGLLTSSRAYKIMHPTVKGWEGMRDAMWAEGAEMFDNPVKTGARAWGHQQEIPGAAKFWEAHPEILDMLPGGFHIRHSNDELDGWIASSPDRQLMLANGEIHGLEVKSPENEETFLKHTLRKHMDQCQHGLFVTGWAAWRLYIHLGNKKPKEFIIPPSAEWQKKYIKNAKTFLQFCYAGKELKTRRVSAKRLLG